MAASLGVLCPVRRQSSFTADFSISLRLESEVETIALVQDLAIPGPPLFLGYNVGIPRGRYKSNLLPLAPKIAFPEKLEIGILHIFIACQLFEILLRASHPFGHNACGTDKKESD